MKSLIVVWELTVWVQLKSSVILLGAEVVELAAAVEEEVAAGVVVAAEVVVVAVAEVAVVLGVMYLGFSLEAKRRVNNKH